MKSAIKNFIDIDYPNKFFVLGDMLELGEDAHYEHLQIIKQLKEYRIKGIFVGEIFNSNKNNSEYNFFLNINDARQYLALLAINNSLILIKGSRGIKLEQLMDLF